MGIDLNSLDRRVTLLETASKLFNQHGFHATGIDLIIKESGTSKATLYKYFKNKETLIVEVLKHRQKNVMSMIGMQLKQNKDDNYPILSIFDLYHEWFQQRDFYGCFFQKASAEFGDTKSAVNQYCLQAKTDLLDVFAKSLNQSNTASRTEWFDAKSIMYLLDGSIVDAQISKNKDSALQAKQIAYRMLSS